MPIYEYYCGDCNGVFELLRPARQASQDQPCPQCDASSKRIVSRDFMAFIHREGYPRRIPDDGSYYHLGQKVSAALTGGDGFHPELNPREPLAAPSVEELEVFEQYQVDKKHLDPDIGTRVFDESTRKEDEVKQRIVRTKGSPTVERLKQSAKKVAREANKARRIPN